MYQKRFKKIIRNKKEETTINLHWLHKGTMRNIYPSLTTGLMESHQIFSTTANLEKVRKKATN